MSQNPVRPARLFAIIALAAASLTALPVSEARADASDSRVQLAQSGEKPARPPKEAIDACSGKSNGASCSFAGKDGTSMSGTCKAPDSKTPAACAPAGAPAGGAPSKG
ncbi:hypothetical protein Q4543_06210 [Salipiger sp. 1_MG-2023]|uniref:hypothetical protein n=1 Tax=Salipiger sp. 1_MG-2023 TaxID=3062665 RepID=UPI0026E28179|nr:hypothetical protein [Salipiger sp. 1_MG-2023]MDO6585106.1 hypothetical protein [Salipiger sp. 1_MG-2023]